ncbi:MAG: hypothetical protein ACK4UV_09035, partial [Ignavibacterium sp.]
ITIDELKKLNLTEFYKKGFVNFLIKKSIDKDWVDLPVNLISNEKKEIKTKISIGARPNFMLKKNGKIVFIVVNGFLQRVSNNSDYKGNGLIYK